MGQLVKNVEEFADLDEDLKKRIREALTRRNHLTRNYWREKAFEFRTAEGREKIIAELSKDTDTFEGLADEAIKATQPVRERLGISEEKLSAGVEKQLAELQEGMVLK